MISFSDANRSRILTVSPASQLNRTAGLNGGVDAMKPPIVFYSLQIRTQPVRR